ncbi:MAG: zinc ribbon domain-containing protein [Eubacteriaceae bacterium]|nr:zinc ribbon domain-containing protein [Eubacteriaceae bacterium]
MANFCGKCGAPLEAGDRFCMNCGEPVKTLDEELTVPLKSSDEKEIPKEPKGSENASEKKIGLAARAVRQSDNSHEISQDISKEEKGNAGESADADNVLEQKVTENRRNDHSTKDEASQRSETQKNEVASKTAPKTNGKNIAIIVGVVVGLIAIGALIYCFAAGILPPKTTVPIAFKINIDNGFNNESTPIVAKITDKSDKSKVTYTTFTPEDKNGKEIEVPKGQYEIVMISPVNADGSIYDMGKTVSVDTATEEERSINTNCKRITAENATSAQIQGIADALKEASGNESVEISESEINKANERVKAKQVEEEKQRKAAEKQAAIDNAIAQGYSVYEGTMHYCTTMEEFDQYSGNTESFNAELRKYQLYRLPYAILVFDTNQDVTASPVLGSNRERFTRTRSCNLIAMENPNNWQQYDGKRVTLAVDPNTTLFPTSATPLNTNATARNAYVVSED